MCNTESIFLCVSTSEAQPPLLHITTLTTGGMALLYLFFTTNTVVNRPEVTIICVLSLASRLISAHSDERDDESVVCVCVCVCVCLFAGM